MKLDAMPPAPGDKTRPQSEPFVHRKIARGLEPDERQGRLSVLAARRRIPTPRYAHPLPPDGLPSTTFLPFLIYAFF